MVLQGGKLQKIVERIPKDEKMYEPLLQGPETVLIDEDGVIYIMSAHSKLVSLTDFERDDSEESFVMTAKATEVAYLGGGRPLGGKFVSTDSNTQTLYAADAVLGLIRVQNIPRIGVAGKDGKQVKQPNNVEIVAKRVKMEDGSWSEIRFADDLDIGPKTGHVYFTDGAPTLFDFHPPFIQGDRLTFLFIDKFV